jgi:hypothetical protein
MRGIPHAACRMPTHKLHGERAVVGHLVGHLVGWSAQRFCVGRLEIARNRPVY